MPVQKNRSILIYYGVSSRGLAQMARVLRSGRRGRRFESGVPDM